MQTRRTFADSECMHDLHAWAESLETSKAAHGPLHPGKGTGGKRRRKARKASLVAQLMRTLLQDDDDDDEEIADPFATQKTDEGAAAPVLKHDTVEVECIFKAEDGDLQVVYGEVFAPTSIPDVQADVMSAETVRDMGWRFLAMGRVEKIDLKHDNREIGASVVESFIARKGDPTFNEGAWVLGVFIPDVGLWRAIKNGEFNGFSLQALTRRKEVEVEILVPEEITGTTDKSEDHDHEFVVEFDAEGNFAGGRTSIVNSHFHSIVRGSATSIAKSELGVEIEGAHAHRYNFVDQLMALQEEG